mmetsp:Transcript_20560/g.58451  ORF Transcript_20560/g.58451 Transcript_20560/m.58451 type:complete len:120 (-) Transcript_20560:70-429(-)
MARKLKNQRRNAAARSQTINSNAGRGGGPKHQTGTGRTAGQNPTQDVREIQEDGDVPLTKHNTQNLRNHDAPPRAIVTAKSNAQHPPDCWCWERRGMFLPPGVEAINEPVCSTEETSRA